MPEGLFTKLDADDSGTLSQAELANVNTRDGGKGRRGAFKGLPDDVDKTVP